MNTILLLLPSLFVLADTVPAEPPGVSMAPVSAVTAIGAALLWLVARTLPAMHKDTTTQAAKFADTLDTIVERFTTAIDDKDQRHAAALQLYANQIANYEVVIRELTVQCARRGSEHHNRGSE